MGRLDGKVSIVTGAGSGIGRATATLLREEGASVVALEFDEAAAASVESDLGVVPVVGSVDDEEAWQAALAAAGELGGLDVVHLNAGRYGFAGPIEELPLDLYRSTVGANVDGVVLGVRACVPVLRERGGGSLVATASVAGIVPFPPNPLYTLTKYAVTAFVAALAPTLAVDRVTFNAVCPGVVDTPMTVGALGGADPRELGMPLISPDTIAAVVVDLATGEATGQCVAVMPNRDPIPFSFPDWRDLWAAGPPA